jgi:sulfate adenylyltransferase large subunit
VSVGSVDDGKSTLIGRLLVDGRGVYEDQLDHARDVTARRGGEGIDLSLITDGLRAEREQGITIDVAHRYFATLRRSFVIADCPGHEQYTRNMVTGASQAHAAVLLVDARRGLLTQSRRHAFLASLLGIPHLIVAVNKMDMVDWREDRFLALRDEFREWVARLPLRDVRFVPISALLGDMVVSRGTHLPWYEGPTLLTTLEDLEIASDRNLIDLRFPVQLVVRPGTEALGERRCYLGRVESGGLRPGDEVLALPSGRRSRVERIVTQDGDLPAAFAPQSVGLVLEGDLDLGRGDLIVRPGNQPHSLRELDTTLAWLDDSPLVPDGRYLLRHTTRTVRAQVLAPRYRIDPNTLRREDARSLEANEVGRVLVRLASPVFVDDYARNRSTGAVVLIDEGTGRTAAAGMVSVRGSGEEPAAHAGDPVPTNS